MKEKISNGFTLVEMIVTIAVFGLAMLAVAGFIILGFRTNSYAFQQSQAIDEARRGVETMAKEIREARAGQSGAYVIEKAEDFEFIFYSDVDRDSNIEKVRYFIDGTNFEKGVTEPTALDGFSDLPVRYLSQNETTFVLSKYVRNSPPIFRYFDENNQELPSPARRKDAQLMRLTLVINVNPNRPPQDFILESEVRVRNLR